jgi:hypothetical protein
MADMAVTSANVRAMVEFGADVVAGLAGATLTVAMRSIRTRPATGNTPMPTLAPRWH